MNGGIRYVQYPIFGREMEVAQERFHQQLFQSPRLAVAGAIKRHATVSLSFFEESCAACSSLKVEDDIVISVNRYFY